MELTSLDGPRLALLDWMMPEMDGLEVCRRVRSGPERPYVYITMLTSKLSSEDVVAGLEAGSDDYITKPCNPEELKAGCAQGSESSASKIRWCRRAKRCASKRRTTR